MWPWRRPAAPIRAKSSCRRCGARSRSTSLTSMATHGRLPFCRLAWARACVGSPWRASSAPRTRAGRSGKGQPTIAGRRRLRQRAADHRGQARATARRRSGRRSRACRGLEHVLQEAIEDPRNETQLLRYEQDVQNCASAAIILARHGWPLLLALLTLSTRLPCLCDLLSPADGYILPPLTAHRLAELHSARSPSPRRSSRAPPKAWSCATLPQRPGCARAS